MFKRLFLLSGIIALIITSLVMWLWYIPNHPVPTDSQNNEMNQTATDTVAVQDSIAHIE